MNLKSYSITGTGLTAILGGVTAYYWLKNKENKKEEITKVTVKDALTSNGIKLINGNEEDKIWALALREINDNLDNEIELPFKDQDTLKIWCISIYEKHLAGEEELEKAKKFCEYPALTVKERLKKEGKSFTENWKGKLETINIDSSLLRKLKTIDDTLTNIKQDEATEVALKGWCNKQPDVELTPQGFEYEDVRSLCV